MPAAKLPPGGCWASGIDIADPGRNLARPARLLLAAIVALGLAPGTWWRSPLPPPAFEDTLEVAELADPQGLSGALKLTGAWRLDHANPFFGGFSALVWLGEGRFRAASDRALQLDFDLPAGQTAPAALRPARSGGAMRTADDLEALALDPASGRMWLAFESDNVIERHDPDGTIHQVAPPQMAGWPVNGGAESLVRLADGRFLVLGESRDRAGGEQHPGLLFASDPAEGAAASAFSFRAPVGYRPVDAALLPDGRIMILLRRVVSYWPARFASALMVADPARIEPGKVWRGAIVARLGAPDLAENFEGLAVVPRGSGGAADLYLISDDNLSPGQRTLLLRIDWPGAS